MLSWLPQFLCLNGMLKSNFRLIKISKIILLLIFGIKPSVANDNAVYLQLGAFLNKDNASNLVKTTQKRTKTPVIIKDGKRFHMVRVGPLKDKEAAVHEQHVLNYKDEDVSFVELAALSATNLSQTTSTEVKPSTPEEMVVKTKAKALKHETAFKPPVIKSDTVAKTEDEASKPPILHNKINPNYKPKAKAKRLWNLRQADIRSVINEVAKETGHNFIIDPRVQGKISIISGTPIDADELYQVFLSIMQVSGFAVIPAGKVTKIIPNIDARSLGSDDWRNIRGHGRGDEMVVQIVPVKYVSSEQLVPILRPLMPQWSNIAAYGPSNMLILSGRASNIKRLAYIIHQVDSSSSNGIDMVPLKHALAMDVVATIKALLETQKTRSYQRHATVAADDKSNTILISGPKAERMRVRILISQLDRQNRNNNGNTEVVYLHYLRAQDLIPILAGVAKANFSGSVETTIGTITQPQLDSSTPNNSDGGNQSSGNDTPYPQLNQTMDSNNAAPNTQAASNASEGDKKPKVEIIAEPNTNAIIMSGPNAVMRTLKTIIRRLDVRPRQVLVEALIAEIDEKDVNTLGVEWGMVANINGQRAFQPGFAVINSRVRLSNFQLRLSALVNSRRANILSTPSVVVLDNRQAKILVGKEVSVQDSTYPGTAAGGGPANPYSTFTRKNVALHLYVRPQISHGRSIQMQIDHGNDTLADATDPTSGRPVFNKSSILTSVLVNSGDILVLGGLVQNGLSRNGQRIPILGDLPGVGELFKLNRRTHDKKVLMVFIRPIILNSEKTSLEVTGSKYYDVRHEQLNWMQNEPYHEQNMDLVVDPHRNIRLPDPFTNRRFSNNRYEHRR